MTREVKIIIFGGLATLALTLGGVFLLTGSSSSSPETDTSAQAQLIRDYTHQTATQSAQVTLIEFGDYQCPACAGVFPAVEKLKSDYAGSLNFVYRNFPLSQHRFAKKAALAAEAAGLQDKYWEMYSLLYVRQSDWSDHVNPDGLFLGYANELGLDTAKFTADLTQSELGERISTDIRDGNLLGVDSTPTFFLNGKMYNGSMSYEAIKSEIEKILTTTR